MKTKNILFTIIMYFILNTIIVFFLTYFNANLAIKPISIISNKFGLLYTFFILVFLGPFVEEIIFRWSLKYSSTKIYISTFLGVLFYFNSIYLLEFDLKQIMISLFVIIILFVIIKFVIIKHNILGNEKNLKIYSYLLAILFGMYHFKMIVNINYFSVFPYLYILPKIILGVFLNKIRVNYGMKYNIGVHMFINLLGSFDLILEFFK